MFLRLMIFRDFFACLACLENSKQQPYIPPSLQHCLHKGPDLKSQWQQKLAGSARIYWGQAMGQSTKQVEFVNYDD